jgi:hypothetical protein
LQPSFICQLSVKRFLDTRPETSIEALEKAVRNKIAIASQKVASLFHVETSPLENYLTLWTLEGMNSFT